MAGVCIFLQITWPMLALFGCTFLYDLAPRSTREVDLGAKYIFQNLKGGKEALANSTWSFLQMLPPIFI